MEDYLYDAICLDTSRYYFGQSEFLGNYNKYILLVRGDLIGLSPAPSPPKKLCGGPQAMRNYSSGKCAWRGMVVVIFN